MRVGLFVIHLHAPGDGHRLCHRDVLPRVDKVPFPRNDRAVEGLDGVLQYLDPVKAVDPRIWVYGGDCGTHEEAVRVLSSKGAKGAV